MASRTEQKAAARAAREAQQRQLKAAATRRMRLYSLGGMLAVAVIALVVIIVASSGGGGNKPVHLSKGAQAIAIAAVDKTLAGIPQSGNVLGNPGAPITITEYGDLVCPVCAAFEQTTQKDIIAGLIRTGKAKLVYRGFETASSKANASQYVNTQVAASSAGLQGKEWNYILLAYEEQPTTIGGTAAELVPYITTAYLQNLASQIKGLNLAQWQAHMTDKTLIRDVAVDENDGTFAGATGTPAIFVKGPKGTLLYDKSNTEPSVIPTLQQIQGLIAQVS